MPIIKLTEAQQVTFRKQLMLVLADYQGTMPATCPKCYTPLRPATDDAVLVRARLEGEELVAGNKYCVSCGADAYGFARGEAVRNEVAQRIMENLKLCMKQ